MIQFENMNVEEGIAVQDDQIGAYPDLPESVKYPAATATGPRPVGNGLPGISMKV